MTPPLSPDEVFAAALALADLRARSKYLDRACAGHPGLRQEVESLLAAAERAGTFLEAPAPDAGEVLREARQSASVPLTEKPGDRVGRYRLLEQIGEGGFGVVWMAEQEEPVRRRVALKIIKLGMDTREVVARFEAERQALAMMDHPSIAHVFDGGATDTGRPYFVMELVKGIPITTFCDERKLSTRGRLELFMQVCQAVQHAHQKGVIHRELKPTNVLVTVQDERAVPKVIDFGIAKATQSRLTEKTIFTRFQQWIGTPAYMSPEQAGLGSLDVDTRSDIYSLGVLLYELLTGRTPFDTQKLLSSGYDAVMRTIREEEPPKPSTRLSTLAEGELNSVAAQSGAEPAKLGRLVRGDLDWIVTMALEKDRTRRYDTAASLSQDVERHLRAEPVSAAAPAVGYRLGKFVRRNGSRLAFATLAATAVALALVGGKFALNHHSANQTVQATETNAVFALARTGDAKAIARLLGSNPLLVNEHDVEGSTPLIYAAGAGNTNTLPLLIARGAAVDATNHAGLTALGNAAGNNRAATALMLIAAGADPNHPDASGVTPLHAASMFGSVEVGRALLAKGARTDVFAQSAGLTPLSQAAMVGHADFVDLLLAHRASVATRDASGHTPLHVTATGQRVTDLLRSWQTELEKLANRGPGREAVAMAVEQMSNRAARLETTLPVGSLLGGGEHSRVAEALLAHGAALEATNNDRCTPLLTAALYTNLSVVEVLIAHKANLDARAKNGSTPLNLVALKGSVPVADLLLKAGADANLPDDAGFTPLHTAVEQGQIEVVRLLLTRGAHPNLACPGGQTPLHSAAATGDLELMGLLLDRGAYLHSQSKGGPPLCSAVGSEKKAAVEFLLQRGANPNLATPEGNAALHNAVLLGQPELVEWLLQNGASNNMVGPMGTPLHLACAGREPARQWLSSAVGQAPAGWHVHPPTLGSEADYQTVVKLLLASGADVNAREPAYQRTPLFMAIRAGNAAVVEALLAVRADIITACDTVGTTPLHAVSESQASASAVSNIVVRLLQAGAAPDARDNRRATPLHAAAYGGRLEAAALLIHAGASVNAPGPFLATPLHMAVQSGNRSLVELLLAHRADVERRTSEGATALGAAVVMRAEELVQVLLAHDANPNAAALDGTTMLMVASQAGATKLMMALLDHGAEIHTANQLGMTALLNAAAGGSVDSVRLLLDRGAKSGVTDRHGNTLLLTAAKAGRVEMLNFLLELGASLADHDDEGFTALHGAADHGHAEGVEFLLGRGLDVNSRSITLYTPLHCAANAAFTNETQYMAVAGVLLAHGADVNAQTRESQTPLHRAASWGRPQIIQALLAAGADPNARDSDGKTALDLAKVFDHPR